MPTPLVAFPWGSASSSSVRRSAIAREAARLTAVVVLPTPPFWLAIATMWAMKGLIPVSTCWTIIYGYYRIACQVGHRDARQRHAQYRTQDARSQLQDVSREVRPSCRSCRDNERQQSFERTSEPPPPSRSPQRHTGTEVHGDSN